MKRLTQTINEAKRTEVFVYDEDVMYKGKRAVISGTDFEGDPQLYLVRLSNNKEIEGVHASELKRAKISDEEKFVRKTGIQN